MRQTDDSLAKRSILLVIEAVRAGFTDSSRALELLADAAEVAERIDAPRGRAKQEDSAE